MTEVPPPIDPEILKRDQFARRVANIIARSYDFSQGYSPNQKYILQLFSCCLGGWIEINQDLELKIFDYLKRYIDGRKDETSVDIAPVILSAIGAHADILRNESLSNVGNYIIDLEPEGRTPEDVEGLVTLFVVGFLSRDIRYLFGVSKSRSEARIVGRPGSSRTVKSTDYDNSKTDKFFSYTICYLLKGDEVKEHPDPVFAKALKMVRDSKLFRNLIEGTVGGRVQTYFDSLILRYNETHSGASGYLVHLGRPLGKDQQLFDNVGNPDYKITI